jgi:hypothetical protein
MPGKLVVGVVGDLRREGRQTVFASKHFSELLTKNNY